MTDYVTYAELIRDSAIEVENNPDNSSIYGSTKDGTRVIFCRSLDPKFNSLLKILNLSEKNLPTVKVRMIKKEFWKENAYAEYEGEDFPLFHIHWLNTKSLVWRGTEQEYEYYTNDMDAESKYEWVEYGDIKSEYPSYNEDKDSYLVDMPCILFKYHEGALYQCGCWTNWLGENAKYGEFDCVFWAKDAAKHVNYKTFNMKLDIAELFISNVEDFAREVGEENALIFGFG